MSWTVMVVATYGCLLCEPIAGGRQPDMTAVDSHTAHRDLVEYYFAQPFRTTSTCSSPGASRTLLGVPAGLEYRDNSGTARHRRQCRAHRRLRRPRLLRRFLPPLNRHHLNQHHRISQHAHRHQPGTANDRASPRHLRPVRGRRGRQVIPGPPARTANGLRLAVLSKTKWNAGQ